MESVTVSQRRQDYALLTLRFFVGFGLSTAASVFLTPLISVKGSGVSAPGEEFLRLRGLAGKTLGVPGVVKRGLLVVDAFGPGDGEEPMSPGAMLSSRSVVMFSVHEDVCPRERKTLNSLKRGGIII